MRSKGGYLVLAILVVALLLALLFLSSRSTSPIVPESAIVTRLGPPSAYPDGRRTPGAVNPDVTQENIQETICNPHWSTKSVRPPESYTSRLKASQMQEAGLMGRSGDYEEDHLISLELGGSPTDPRNLWPEAYEPRPGAREKDVVENYLHKQVCSGVMQLQDAQQAIAADWYKVYVEIRR